MSGCQHCAGLEREMGEVRTIVTRIDQELLGGDGKPGRMNVHSDRLGRLERWRSYMTGALAVIGLLMTAAIALGAAAIAHLKP